MPVDRDSETYNMNHKRRGLAIIFNHKSFDKNLGLGIRNGTDVDRDNLSKTLKQLGFDVEAYNDLKFKDLVGLIVLLKIWLNTLWYAQTIEYSNLRATKCIFKARLVHLKKRFSWTVEEEENAYRPFLDSVY